MPFMTMHQFANRMRTLVNLDKHDLPGFSARDWHQFRRGPMRYFVQQADDERMAMIWEAIEKRQPENREPPGIYLGPTEADLARLDAFPIDTVDMTTRCRQCLTFYTDEFKTWGDVARASDKRLLGLHRLGKTTLAEIRTVQHELLQSQKEKTNG